MDRAVSELVVAGSRPARTHGGLVVSVENSLFTSSFLAACARSLSSWHDSFTVIVADDLMAYNKLHMKGAPEEFWRLIRQYRHDRQTHLTRLRRSLRLSADRMRIGFYGDYCDREYSQVMRRFYMIVMTDGHLFDLFHEEASGFTARSMASDGEGWTAEQRYRSSMAYLIEETVWTVYLYATKGITDIYYPGDFGHLIESVYTHGRYGEILAFLGLPRHSSRFWNLRRASDGRVERKLAWRYGDGS